MEGEGDRERARRIDRRGWSRGRRERRTDRRGWDRGRRERRTDRQKRLGQRAAGEKDRQTKEAGTGGGGRGAVRVEIPHAVRRGEGGRNRRDRQGHRGYGVEERERELPALLLALLRL